MLVASLYSISTEIRFINEIEKKKPNTITGGVGEGTVTRGAREAIGAIGVRGAKEGTGVRGARADLLNKEISES